MVHWSSAVLTRSSTRSDATTKYSGARLTFQMDLAALPHATLMRAIELIGTRVAPALQAETLVGV